MKLYEIEALNKWGYSISSQNNTTSFSWFSLVLKLDSYETASYVKVCLLQYSFSTKTNMLLESNITNVWSNIDLFNTKK